MKFINFIKLRLSKISSPSFLLSFGLHMILLVLMVVGINYVPPIKLEGLTVTTASSIPGSSKAKKTSADVGPLPPVAKKVAPKIKEDIEKPKPPKKTLDGELDPIKEKKDPVKDPSTKNVNENRAKAEKERAIEDLKRLLNTVEELRGQERTKDETITPQKAKPKDDLTFLQESLDEILTENKEDIGSVIDSSGSGLEPSDFDALRKQFVSCWSIPIGNKGVENYKVVVELEINNEGYVQDARLKYSNQTGNPGYQSLAESVLRAVWHPLCSPLKLPLDRFPVWKNMIVTFDPVWIVLG